jgi:hypothetical protein
MSITEQQELSNNNNNEINLVEEKEKKEEPKQQDEQQQQPTTSAMQEYIKSLDEDYFNEIKENAKLKTFTVTLDGGHKKIYLRRKVTMREIAEIEKKREVLRAGKGSPLDKANALLDFYWFSAQCHLRETKTDKAMSKNDYENVTFEDFKKIIDACEFIMLYGVPKN